MTGEVTLRGRVLQIGGLKEKILAAKRVGIYTVIMPDRNRKDLTDIPKHLLQGMTFVFADTMEEVLHAALRSREPKGTTDKAIGVAKPAKAKLLKPPPGRRPVAAIAGTVR
jgi:ATP-dependent Lon protease